MVKLEVRVVQRDLLDSRHHGPLEADASGKYDFSEELLLRDRVQDVVALYLADAIDFEGGDVLAIFPIDFRALRWQELGECLREDFERTAPVLTTRNLLDRPYLRGGSGRINVQPSGSVSFVDCFRPPETHRKRHSIEFRVSESPFPDLVPDESLAMARRRKPVEIARATIRAVTTLDILCVHVPFCGQEANPRSCREKGPRYIRLPSRPFTPISRGPSYGSYSLQAYPEFDGSSRRRWATRASTPTDDSRRSHRRNHWRPRVVCDVGDVRHDDDAHRSRRDRLDGSCPLLRPDPRHDGRDDAALGVADGARLSRDDAPRGRAADETRGCSRDRRVRRPLLCRVGRVRGRRSPGPRGPRPHGLDADGSRPLPPRRGPGCRGTLAGHTVKGSVSDPLHRADGFRPASLAQWPSRRDAHGLPACPVLHRLLLAVHARPLRRGLDEPRLDGRIVRRDFRRKGRPSSPTRFAGHRDRPRRVRRGPSLRHRRLDVIPTPGERPAST